MITVVIPLYNKGDCIARAVDSVLAQTESDWELLVVDDGSTDNGPDVVTSYGDQRIRLIRQANAGVSAARNAGLMASRSDKVAFLDADDYWGPAHLSDLKHASQAFPDCVFWTTAYWVVAEDGQKRALRFAAEQTGQTLRIDDYFSQANAHEPPVHSSAVMVDKSAALAVGGFVLGVTAGEDLIMWARLACRGGLAFVGRPTAFYVDPPVSLEARPHFLRRPQQPDPVAAVLHELMATAPNQASLRQYLSDWHRIRAMLFLERNERRCAWHELREAIKHGPMRTRDVVSAALLLLPPGLRARAVAAIRARRRAASVAHEPVGLVRAAIVTNIPAPYRLPVYEAVAADPACNLTLIFCSGSEPDRAWRLQTGQFDQVYLKERFLSIRGRFIHVNPDVWGALKKAHPDVVITTGYNPTHLLAFAYACIHRIPHVVMTDGTRQSEAGYSRVHRWIRQVVAKRSAAFVGPSNGSFELFAQYGVPADKMFKSQLCANNAAFESVTGATKRFDLLFSGRMVEIKNPAFALDVAEQVARRLGRRVSIGFLGSGELEAALKARAQQLSEWVDAHFLGFVQQAELPQHYAAARVFLFPSSWDPWGVVANEANAAGVPVVVTPQAGVAGDLIRDGENGFVLPLSLPAWTDACVRLLTDPALYGRMSVASRERVQGYRFDVAAHGLLSAIQLAAASKGARP